MFLNQIRPSAPPAFIYWSLPCSLPSHLVMGLVLGLYWFPWLLILFLLGRNGWCDAICQTLHSWRATQMSLKVFFSPTAGLATCCCSQGHGLNDQSPEIAHMRVLCQPLIQGFFRKVKWLSFLIRSTRLYWKLRMDKALWNILGLKHKYVSVVKNV